MNITMIMPTYNEAENLPQIAATVLDLPAPVSLLIVDDGSPDGTGEIAEKLALDYPGRLSVMHRKGKLGLGTAYIQGFRQVLETNADAIGQMDADFSHPPRKILELAAALEESDVAVGSRYIAGGGLDENWPAWRKGLSSFGNLYTRIILNLPVKDGTGGFRLWRRSVLENMPLDSIRSNGYVFQVEMAYVAHRMGYRFKEIPIYFSERRFGTSKMSFRIQVEAAIRVWQLLWIHRGVKPVDINH
ncbi:MAG: polyprenol monophosphomannose synthase [Chloroflexi bacterium]|nr:polyprenol monophosphomannose synthase [Chloroflexota bacterium]